MNRSTPKLLVAAGLCWAVLSGCDKKEPPAASAAPAASTAPAASLPPPNPDNNVYFGAVHVHTGWSFDAFTNGSKTTPSDAYAWAQGKAITGSGGPGHADQDPARLLHGVRPRRVHGRVQPDGEPRQPAEQDRTRQGRDLARRQRGCRPSPASCAT